LSYKASSQCVGQELNLHSECGWVTATWARQCPADTYLSVAQGELNPLHPSNSARVVCRLPTGPQSSAGLARRHIRQRGPAVTELFVHSLVRRIVKEQGGFRSLVMTVVSVADVG